jgi:CRISPR-associated exonuclease Cas4
VTGGLAVDASVSATVEPAYVPLTVTHLLEHLFCPRFTYFEYVLGVPERQERRPLVMSGRAVHEERRHTNPTYLRKKLGVVKRQFDVPLASATLGVRGSVDEVLTLADGSMAPFDYKFAEAPKKVYHNQRMQSALYALLIAETFGVAVRRGFLCFVRSKHRIVELEFGEADFAEVKAVLAEILSVIRNGVFPAATRWPARCRDCCYRNICIQ